MHLVERSLHRFAAKRVDVVADHGDEEDDGPDELVPPLHREQRRRAAQVGV